MKMFRHKYGPPIILLGIAILFISLFYLLPLPGLYILSLFMMFFAVVLIGVGAAFVRGADRSLDVPSDDCYYCKGTGKIQSGEELETCPRCGGTGLARPDDIK